MGKIFEDADLCDLMCGEPLKPCPFCGGNAVIVNRCRKEKLVYVMCEKCFAYGTQVSKYVKGDPVEKAIEFWNRRI